MWEAQARLRLMGAFPPASGVQPHWSTPLRCVRRAHNSLCHLLPFTTRECDGVARVCHHAHTQTQVIGCHTISQAIPFTLNLQRTHLTQSLLDRVNTQIGRLHMCCASNWASVDLPLPGRPANRYKVAGFCRTDFRIDAVVTRISHLSHMPNKNHPQMTHFAFVGYLHCALKEQKECRPTAANRHTHSTKPQQCPHCPAGKWLVRECRATRIYSIRRRSRHGTHTQAPALPD